VALTTTLLAIREPYTRDITVIQGANFRRSWIIKVGGVAVDLTGCTVTGRISTAYLPSTGIKLVDLTCTLTGTPTDGTVIVTLTNAQTAALTAAAGANPGKIGVWEIDISDGTNKITPLRGACYLHAQPVES
jgi:hypothetical protein